MIHFVVFIFLIWRIGLFIIAFLGGKLLAFAPKFPYSDVFLTPSRLPSWFWSFANFDGVHYLTIAKSGYSAGFTQVFFPLYPLLIRLVNSAVPVNPIVVGLFISNIFFLLSLVIFKRLLLIDYKKESVKWMILFLLFFPTSFFFGSLYTESLFLFLVFSSFYAARKKKWLLSGILGGFASATRLAGIFLLPALLWEGYREKLKSSTFAEASVGKQNSKVKSTTQSSKLMKFYRSTLHFTLYTLHLPILYLVPLGLLSYMIYLQIKFGDFLYFWHIQPVFGAERSGASIILLPQVIWRYIKILLSVSVSAEIFWISVLELLSVLLAITLLTIAHIKKVRFSYLIFSWFCVIIPTLTGTFSSMPRYILVAFPMFIVLGIIKGRLLKIFLSSIFYLLSSILTILFTRGHWIA